MFELLIAVPLGIVAATKQYSVTDYTVTTVALLGMSLPTFFFATLLKLVFSVKLTPRRAWSRVPVTAAAPSSPHKSGAAGSEVSA